MEEQHYLRDVFYLLLERGRAAAERARQSRSVTPSLGARFDEGLAQGYYEAISTMLSQLDAFGITRASLGLPEDLDLERDFS